MKNLFLATLFSLVLVSSPLARVVAPAPVVPPKDQAVNAKVIKCSAEQAVLVVMFDTKHADDVDLVVYFSQDGLPLIFVTFEPGEAGKAIDAVVLVGTEYERMSIDELKKLYPTPCDAVPKPA